VRRSKQLIKLASAVLALAACGPELGSPARRALSPTDAGASARDQGSEVRAALRPLLLVPRPRVSGNAPALTRRDGTLTIDRTARIAVEAAARAAGEALAA
jgi:hypothetical protein